MGRDLAYVMRVRRTVTPFTRDCHTTVVAGTLRPKRRETQPPCSALPAAMNFDALELLERLHDHLCLSVT